MRKRLTKLAVIVGRYNHPNRPFIANWADAIQSSIKNADIYCRRFSIPKSNTVLEVLDSSGKIETIVFFIMNCIKRPLQSLNWYFARDGLSIKEKITAWARYAPLLRNNPTVIHLLNSYLYQRYSNIIKKLRSISIVTFHGGDILIRPIVSAEWSENMNKLFIQCDHLHFVSNYLRKKAIDLGAPQDKTFVIYPGIDVQFYQPDLNKGFKSENEIIITTIGHLMWEKGIPYGLRAVKYLKNKGFDVRYWIVGDGVEKEQILYWIKELDIEENVRLFGYQSVHNIKSILSKSDIYLQPSIYEAFGVSIIEASAMELPVIASNVGGIPEIVDNNITGILIPANNEQKIEESIISLICNKDKRVEMGKNGRKKVLKEFTIERMISNWQKIYDNILTSSC